MKNRAEIILKILQESKEWLSGEKLSKELNISRNAIWKHISNLQKEGYDIRSAHRIGYRYAGFNDNLDAKTFQQINTAKIIGRNFNFKQQINSTNLWALQEAMKGAEHGSLFVADCQTTGLGKKGSSWSSPPGRNLYLSVVIRMPNIDIANATKISATATSSMASAIRKECITNKIEVAKNGDIIVLNKKCGGTLTCVHGDIDNLDFIIIGIGILLNMRQEEYPKEWLGKMISLHEITTSDIERTNIIARFCNELEIALSK